MASPQLIKISDGALKSNRRWLIASFLSGALPFSLDFFQDFVPEISYFESNEQLASLVDVLVITLIFSIPLLVCSFAVLRLYKWWKLVPVVMLVFNTILILLYVALANWNTAS